MEAKPRTATDHSGPAPSPRAAAGARSNDALDQLIDEIDNVLEENAEVFVKSYVQRGGQ
jgi:prokaryotic ubiquitin-like protein Pup